MEIRSLRFSLAQPLPFSCLSDSDDDVCPYYWVHSLESPKWTNNTPIRDIVASALEEFSFHDDLEPRSTVITLKDVIVYRYERYTIAPSRLLGELIDNDVLQEISRAKFSAISADILLENFSIIVFEEMTFFDVIVRCVEQFMEMQSKYYLEVNDRRFFDSCSGLKIPTTESLINFIRTPIE